MEGVAELRLRSNVAAREEATMGVIGSTYRGAKKTVNWFQNLIAFGILTILGYGGVVIIGTAISDYFSGKADFGLSLIMLMLGFIGVGFPAVFIREKIRDGRLMRWLAAHADELGDGIEGPGGVIYRPDTVLVRYEANLSAIVVSTGFQSGFYEHGSSHLTPKIFYTLFTALFGWWMVDPKLWLENAAAIINNLRDSNAVTVADLFAPESPV